jgi:hypothetical protein
MSTVASNVVAVLNVVSQYEDALRNGGTIPWIFNLSKPTGHVMHQQFNIQQLYALPTLYLCFVFI